MKMIILYILATVHGLIHTSIPFNPNPFPNPFSDEIEEIIKYEIRNPLLTIDEEYLYIPRITKPRVRKEFRDLSPEEWAEYKQTVELLRQHGYLEPLARVHYTVKEYAHNSLEFLPWHRLFLLYFEYLLQSLSNNPNMTVPYWDWTIDAEDPSNSPMLKEFYWGIFRCFLVYEPTTHCLLRTQNKKIDPFYNWTELQSVINKKNSFYEFTIELELIPHALVHLNIGGKYGDMSYMQSTNDPLFWHHHSYVEYIWEKRNSLYRGTRSAKDRLYPEERLDVILYPFNLTARDSINLGAYIIYQPKIKSG
ncbi:tyrosinase [Nematocida parisii]|nr:tyrosinase [Nematocida parisii]KAI5126459.1 tyrosinase [Nematocida parisii]KAI5140716.1 tyrosinase [Nematocida parisii]